jgi:hypothetical protein
MMFCFIALSTTFWWSQMIRRTAPTIYLVHDWYPQSEVFVCAQILRSLSDALWVTTSVDMCHVNFLLIRTVSEIFGCYILVSKRKSVIKQIIPCIMHKKISYLVKESPVSSTSNLQEDTRAEETKMRASWTCEQRWVNTMCFLHRRTLFDDCILQIFFYYNPNPTAPATAAASKDPHWCAPVA